MATILLIFLIIYIIGALVARFFPSILMWLMKRHVRKQMRNAFGEDFDANAGRKSRRRRKAEEQTPKRKGKIITSDVGEYVEFEDIKTFNSQSESQQTTEVKYEEESQITDVEWEDVK